MRKKWFGGDTPFTQPADTSTIEENQVLKQPQHRSQAYRGPVGGKGVKLPATTPFGFTALPPTDDELK